jgi:hypothetical protein
VFGLVHLIDRQYRPQLANLPDQRLWRSILPAGYGPLNHAARSRIDTEKIAAHWEDMCRVAVSIHSGEVSAHDITRMISRDGNPTPLGQAIARYGRIFKTLHILRLAGGEPCRREGRSQADLVAGRHDLARRSVTGRRAIRCSAPARNGSRRSSVPASASTGTTRSTCPVSAERTGRCAIPTPATTSEQALPVAGAILVVDAGGSLRALGGRSRSRRPPGVKRPLS